MTPERKGLPKIRESRYPKCQPAAPHLSPQRLYQIKLYCPFDGRSAILYVEFAVDALGMCTYRTQGERELTGDLWARKLGVEQTENVKLTLG